MFNKFPECKSFEEKKNIVLNAFMSVGPLTVFVKEEMNNRGWKIKGTDNCFVLHPCSRPTALCGQNTYTASKHKLISHIVKATDVYKSRFYLLVFNSHNVLC